MTVRLRLADGRVVDVAPLLAAQHFEVGTAEVAAQDKATLKVVLAAVERREAEGARRLYRDGLLVPNEAPAFVVCSGIAGLARWLDNRFGRTDQW